jgi:putative photosynthetic complex assembly protein 2
MFGLSFLLGLSLWTASISMRSHTVLNAYIGFVSVIAMWSWHEMAFLTGWLTGPRRVVLDKGLKLRQRFVQSVQVLLHHELALLFNFGLLVAIQQGQPNHMALCTFALLWCMRVSAKFNLFFGVPEVGLQYLPSHLTYLGSYFKQGRVSLFFYATVAVSSGAWLWLVWQAQQGVVALTAGWVLLASLLGLAILEHVLMMFPVPLQKLWGWAMSHGHERGFAPAVHAMAPNSSLTPVSLAPVSLLAQGDKP